MPAKVSRRREVAVIVDLLERGKSAKQIAVALATYLREKRQTRLAELYLRDIRAEIQRRFGLVSAEVTSASKLSDELEREIKTFIKNQTDAQKVEIIKTVDPDLIGGVVISTTDAEMDASVRTKLQKLRSI
ncbi:MAG: F0F1 ATP synthase subunit delta [Candidatus Nomurabacteria bacterium]|jgi:F-type H+-transporting ATPase subunit delta|nr:F0F1 ATP synthase subunit delta [Candidatus Nomurabacteria bacterium]